ncbi:MAG: hypothetical protein ONB23_10345 [candidate division KSB1 bacterium]|nr:hypothetical protein [candidate division KSB1 bacterium]
MSEQSRQLRMRASGPERRWWLPVFVFLMAVVVALFVYSPGRALCQSHGGQAVLPPIGFVDENGDGVNDRFVDSNGDGVNDVDGKPYPHTFPYLDQDGDGVNDFWVDADGDGVNDLILKVEFPGQGPRWIDIDGDGIEDRDVRVLLPPGLLWKHVLDADGDGRNDITGLAYRGRAGIQGFRFGKVDEETGQVYENFRDANRDGMHDEALRHGWLRARAGMDLFIDRDGDGIGDSRKVGQGRMRAGRLRSGRGMAGVGRR